MASTAIVPIDAGNNAAPAVASEPPLTGIQPISVKKTLMLVNSFVVGTSDFLNHFTSLCEQKLLRVSQQVQRVEIVLALLESKLDSIGYLGGGGGGAPVAAAGGAPAIADGSAPPAPPLGAAAAPAAPSAVAPAAPAAAAPAAPVCMVKDDSRYAKFFKMVAMGVPKAAVKMKMGGEGLDPDVIDMDPEAPAPAGGAPAGQSQALVLSGGGGDGGGDGSDSEKSDQMSDDDE